MNSIFKFNKKILLFNNKKLHVTNRKIYSNNICIYNLIFCGIICLTSFSVYKYFKHKRELKYEKNANVRSQYELYFDKL